MNQPYGATIHHHSASTGMNEYYFIYTDLHGKVKLDLFLTQWLSLRGEWMVLVYEGLIPSKMAGAHPFIEYYFTDYLSYKKFLDDAARSRGCN